MAEMAEMASHLIARVNQGKDPNVGSAQTQKSASASQVLSTLIPVMLLAAVYVVIFLVFRRIFARIYRPRTFVGSLQPYERTPNLSNTLFGWIPEFYAIPDTWILNHHTLDGFLFLRFLKLTVVMCIVGCLITWPVLFPVNATGGGGKTQLDLLTMANVANPWRYWAHAGCAIIFFGFVIFMITRESIYYINLRQAYFLSPLYAARLSSRTVLFCSVPEEYMDVDKLKAMLGSQVRRIWFARDAKELEDKVEERDKAAMKLEAAETKLIQTANGKKLKAEKKGAAPSSSNEEGLASQYLDQKDRPTHKLKPLIGQKVDTIDWCRGELRRLIPEVDKMQASERAGNAKKLNSVFVEFETLSEAQAAYQSLTHHQILHMAPRFTGMSPEEVIWKNLGISWASRVIRSIVTTTIVVLLVIFWSIPVAFVGAMSNVNALTSVIPALSFITNAIPGALLGVVTGLLPVILLAVLMALLPIFLRYMAKVSGDPTLSAVELTTQNYYFAFQVVQVFLVATIGSAAASSVQSIIQDPSSVTSLLATNIPLANNFYLSYFILQGLGFAGGFLAAIVGLVIFFVLGKLLDKTPRKMYKRWITLSSLGWGTIFPVYTNLFVIAVCYAAIAPLVLGFAAIGMYLFYFAFRYNLMFVSNAQIDTKGRIYPRALQQLFVGLYVAEFCLIGLFAIGTGVNKGAIGPLLLMILFLVFTALYQISLNNALGPLIEFLPKSMDAEERRLLLEERGADHEKNIEDGEHFNGNGSRAQPAPVATPTHNEPAPHKKPSVIQKFMRPDIYNDYATMRRLVPKEMSVHYEPIVEEEAYFHPAITNKTPLLWIPRDSMGISTKECADTSAVIPITDEGAFLDDKNKVVWDAEDGRPPIYEEKVYY